MGSLCQRARFSTSMLGGGVGVKVFKLGLQDMSGLEAFDTSV